MAKPNAARIFTREERQAISSHWTKLAAENKINKDNAWSSEYITVFGDIIKEQEEQGTLDFAAASSGVNAATIIWSYRVDSMYQTALQQLYQTKGVRGRHAQGADGEDGEGAADDANNAAGGAAAGRKQRTHDIVPGATLSSAAALRSKKISLTLDKDPLFRHTTELFDENNPSGLLVLNYSTGRDCEVVFHGGEPLSIGTPADRGQPAHAPTAQVSIPALAAEIASHLSQAPLKDMTPSYKELCGLLNVTPTAAVDDQAMLRAALPRVNPAAMRAQRVPVQPTDPQPQAEAPAHVYDDNTNDDTNMDMDVDMEDVDTQPQVGADDWHGDDASQHVDHPYDAAGPDDDVAAPYVEPGAWFTQAVELGPELHVAAAGHDADSGAGHSEGDVGDMGEDGEEEDDLAASQGGLSELGPMLGGGKFASWAGANSRTHVNSWRYKAQKGTTGGRVRAATATKSRKKQPGVLDFSAPPLLEPKCVPQKSISISRRTKKNYTLPQDMQCKPRELLTVFGDGCLGPTPLDLYRLEDRHTRLQRRQAAAARRADAGLGEGVGLGGYGEGQGPHGDVWGAGDGEDAGYPDTGFDADDNGDVYGDYTVGDDLGGADDDTLLRDQDGLGHTQATDVSTVDALLYGPRQLPHLHAAYTSKQVDVKALKHCIKGELQRQTQDSQSGQTPEVKFDKVMDNLPGAGAQDGVSVHLAFICLLHLANEHGLALDTGGRLDSLAIRLPHAVA